MMLRLTPRSTCKASTTTYWQTIVNTVVLARCSGSLCLHFTWAFKQMASLSWRPNQWAAPGFGGRGQYHFIFNAVFLLFWLIGVIMKITFLYSPPTTPSVTCWAFNLSFEIQIFVCITQRASLWTSVIFEWPAPLWLGDFPGFAN